ncbi:hypothetical protein ACROYT_G031541 [Oculina patagonica]
MKLSIFLITFGVTVLSSVARAKDREVRSPSTWPSGTYGLPKPKSGCPNAHFNEGTRYHDTEDDDSSNEWSNLYTNHLAGYVTRNDMEQNFCMKTQTSPNYVPWPRGKYCIFKNKGNNCPHDALCTYCNFPHTKARPQHRELHALPYTELFLINLRLLYALRHLGFSEGYIYWDDENDDNINRVSGSLPDGVYDRNTKIFYCCRNDGYVTNAIDLPTDRPFVLFKAQNYPCQHVKGMHVREEWFYWDNEDAALGSHYGGKHPDLVFSNNNIKLNYCYYFK